MPTKPDGFVFPNAKCTHRCAFCGWEYTGKLMVGIERARQHRETKHGVVIRHKKRGIGTCGVWTCNKPAVKRIQGRGLCEEHLELVRRNAEKRGWVTIGIFGERAA